ENHGKKSLSGRTDTLMLGKRGRLVRNRCVSLPGETIRSSKGLGSRQCLASDSIRRPARSKSPRRLIVRRAKGRMAWRTSENIVLVGLKIHVGWEAFHINCLGNLWAPTYQRQNVPFKSDSMTASAAGKQAAQKKPPGPKARRVKQGGFTSGRRGIMRIPSFEREKQRTVRGRKPASKIVFGLHMARGEFPATGMRWTHAFHRLCNPAGLIFRIVSL